MFGDFYEAMDTEVVNKNALINPAIFNNLLPPRDNLRGAGRERQGAKKLRLRSKSKGSKKVFTVKNEIAMKKLLDTQKISITDMRIITEDG